MFCVIFFLVDWLMAVHKYLSELFQQTLNRQQSFCRGPFWKICVCRECQQSLYSARFPGPEALCKYLGGFQHVFHVPKSVHLFLPILLDRITLPGLSLPAGVLPYFKVSILWHLLQGLEQTQAEDCSRQEKDQAVVHPQGVRALLCGTVKCPVGRRLRLNGSGVKQIELL